MRRDRDRRTSEAVRAGVRAVVNFLSRRRGAILWVLTVAVLVAAAYVQLARTNEAFPMALVVLMLAAIAAATPAAGRVFERVSEFSAGGVSVKFTASADSVQNRLDLRLGDPDEGRGEGDESGHFLGSYREDISARQFLALQGNLDERLAWIADNLDIPAVSAVGTSARIQRLRWSALLLPDEADLLSTLASVTPTQAEKAQSEDSQALLRMVRASDRLIWRLRSIVFDRQTRQAFGGSTLEGIWRLFDWRPQPSGRRSPWFIAHADQREETAREAAVHTFIVAPRVAPTEGGLANAVKFLNDYRTEIPAGSELQGYVVLRDSSPQLTRASQHVMERARVISLSQLRALALAVTRPSQ